MNANVTRVHRICVNSANCDGKFGAHAVGGRDGKTGDLLPLRWHVGESLRDDLWGYERGIEIFHTPPKPT